jgi:putative ABC transport system permease protein
VKALDRKLLRDLARMLGQVITIGLVVACGVAAYVSIQGTYRSLLSARDSYYERYRFPDVFVHVQRAPEAIAARIAQLPGVARVETRVVESVRIPIADMREPVLGRIVSLPADGKPSLGALALRQGRMFEPGRDDEAVILDAFATAHDLRIDAKLPVVIGGVRRELRVVGIALSPEYVFSIAPGELIPDAKRFGVIWMDRAVVGAALQMSGAFNDVVIRLQPGASESAVIADVNRVLVPYGGLGAHGRDRQQSHNALRGELTQLTTLTTIMPTIFLGVAAFLINVVLSRLVQIQRAQVAVLKAVGYTQREVGVHYLKLVCLLVLCGSTLGIAVGAWLGGALNNIYIRYFHFPSLTYHLYPRVVATAIGWALGSASLGALATLRAVMRLPPAEAMRPEPPASYRRTLADRIRTSPSARMVLREIERRPLRFVLSGLGVAMAVAVLVSGRFNRDAIDWYVTLQFDLAQREDLMVAFRKSVPARAARELAHVPGVLSAEGLRMLPVRYRNGHRMRESVLLGLQPGGELRRAVDRYGRTTDPPASGILMSSALARLLDLRRGDDVTVEVLEGERGTYRIPVRDTIDDVSGLNGYMNAEALAHTLGAEAQISSALLRADPDAETRIRRELDLRPEVLGITRRDAVTSEFRKQTVAQMRFTTFIMTAFAVVIACGVIYNNARIALSTRSRDLASLRVLGFRRAEVSAILLGELALQVLLALSPGMLLGRMIAVAMMSKADPEIYRFPVVISARTYAFAAAVTIGAALASALAVRRRVDRLDLIGVLKSRE